MLHNQKLIEGNLTMGVWFCVAQVVDETTAGRTGRQETNESNEIFLIEIGGLRMATNYTFQVVPQDPIHKYGGRPSQISLQTKGCKYFSSTVFTIPKLL